MDNEIDEQFIDALANEYSDCFKLDTTAQVSLIPVDLWDVKCRQNVKWFVLTHFLNHLLFLLNHLLPRLQQVKLIDEAIEENLTHLEEFCTMLDLIRNENNGYLTDLVPEFRKKKHQLRIVYDKIDKLLELVEVVKNTVDLMESELNKAEIKFNSSNKLSRFFSSLIGSSPDTSTVQAESEFRTPYIFKTNDYFQHSDLNESNETRTNLEQNQDSVWITAIYLFVNNYEVIF